MFLSFALAAPALIGACQSPPAETPSLSTAARGSAPGRWDDLAGALVAAQRGHEMAVLSTSSPSPGVRVITLLTNLDERVVIRAETPAPDDAETPTTLDLRVAYGLWGDETKENAIIQTMRESLAKQARRRAQRP